MQHALERDAGSDDEDEDGGGGRSGRGEWTSAMSAAARRVRAPIADSPGHSPHESPGCSDAEGAEDTEDAGGEGVGRDGERGRWGQAEDGMDKEDEGGMEDEETERSPATSPAIRPVESLGPGARGGGGGAPDVPRLEPPAPPALQAAKVSVSALAARLEDLDEGVVAGGQAPDAVRMLRGAAMAAAGEKAISDGHGECVVAPTARHMEMHEADDDSWSEVHASRVGSHAALLPRRPVDEAGTVLLFDD